MAQLNANSGLRDNYTRGSVADFLIGKIRDGSSLSVVSAYFTIYAYDALKAPLDQIEKKAFIIDGQGLDLANKLQQKRVIQVA
jgi:hypothetical protein